MDDTISRLAVIQIIEKMRARIGHNLERSVGRAMIEILDDVGEDVGKLPSAQPEPLQPWEVLVAQAVLPQPKMGRWIHDGSKWTNRWICSECGYKWFFDCIEGAYCPNCGADMRGEQDG